MSCDPAVRELLDERYGRVTELVRERRRPRLPCAVCGGASTGSLCADCAPVVYAVERPRP